MSQHVQQQHSLLLVTFSAIQLLEEMAASGDSQCVAMATTALNRLFKANLAAKYWVTGILDITDSTAGIEFYDGGPVSAENSVMVNSQLTIFRDSVKTPSSLSLSWCNCHSTRASPSLQLIC